MPSYVLSVLGDDRSGLVEALAAVVTECGGNWERSHMARLAGKFAGIVQVTVPEENADRFLAALAPLQDQGLFDISVGAGSEAAAQEAPQMRLELVGNDHPGIIHRVSELLTRQGVSIDELETWTSAAPMAGHQLFHARVLLRLGTGIPAATLQSDLEDLAVDLMVDLDLA
jgi:glycine cleavage system regulatory protein